MTHDPYADCGPDCVRVDVILGNPDGREHQDCPETAAGLRDTNMEAAEMAMTPAERKQKQREEARAKGFCIDCCQVKAVRGKTKCADCNEAAKAYVRASRE
jgi:hypothetical protein